ncbi:MAG: cytochrome c-type biogenesis protein [Pseudomonadota bacterium]
MKRVLILLCFLLAGPAWAVEPDEVLDDPRLEERARELSKGLRCLVCRNESIDESNAELARDMRILVRERLTAGDSDADVIAYLVERYGEFVLLTPTVRGANLALWLAGPVLFLVGGGIAVAYLRKRKNPVPPEALSEAERTRLDELMRD